MKTLIIFTFVLLSLQTLKAQEIPERPEDISPILIGETIPDALLETPEGDEISLKTIVSRKKTVLVFFRGGWCPFCNTHLVELRKALPSINDLDYQLVAISPDSFKSISNLVEKKELNYFLYSDIKQEAMKKMGIAYVAPEKYLKLLAKYSDGQNSNLIPVPSVFILDKEGKILFEYINPDHTVRLKGDHLIAQLELYQSN